MSDDECEVTPRGDKPNLDAGDTNEFVAALVFGLVFGTAFGLIVLGLCVTVFRSAFA